MGNLVSVIIPTYNGWECIKRSVDSVLSQTYQDIEIIVVDDNGLGSDGQKITAEVMSKYAGNPKVQYICHEKNRNGSAARNTGFHFSKGEYIALLDDDDEYSPTKIERLVAVLDSLSNDYGLVFGNAKGYEGKRLIYSNKAHVPNNPLYNILMHHFSIGTSAFLVRRSAYEFVGRFVEVLIRHQDWEFFCKIIANYKIKAVDTPASIRHITRRNGPRNAEKAMEYRWLYLKKMAPYIQILSEKEQRDVVSYNKLGALINLIKEKRIVDFVRQYLSQGLGIRGAVFLFSYFFQNLQRFLCRYTI